MNELKLDGEHHTSKVHRSIQSSGNSPMPPVRILTLESDKKSCMLGGVDYSTRRVFSEDESYFLIAGSCIKVGEYL